MSLMGKDLICSETWRDSELLSLIDLAVEMKRDPFSARWNALLNNKKFLMLFYNPSLRTHLSFESAVADLGGYPIFRRGDMDWTRLQRSISSSEALKDVARVISRYVDGVCGCSPPLLYSGELAGCTQDPHLIDNGTFVNWTGSMCRMRPWHWTE